MALLPTEAPSEYAYSNLCKDAYDLAIHGNLTREMFVEDWPEANKMRNNLGVLGGLIVMFGILLFFYLYDLRWKRLADSLEKATGVMQNSRTFALALVALFMPSWQLDRYQFRGMQTKSKSVSLEFTDLSLALKTNNKKVLNGVTGRFDAARMCAIMGPSGAGKTTFMNVLCGKATYGQMGGEIKINGTPANISEIKSVMGFVPQDDIVHEHLTVREQIAFSAYLRNKVGTHRKRLTNIVNDVLNVMQVVDIQNSIVGGVEKRGISGGQRKRVNIGLELAAQPTVLFLDEPTSGLDSSSSVAVCASLKKMTQLGMTSVMVIHQPRFSLFTLFDDVLLLGKGGQTVYLGPSIYAKQYFENCGFRMPEDENPADWFMDIIAGELDKDAPAPAGYKPSMLFEMWERRQTRAPTMVRQMTVTDEAGGAGRKIDENDDLVVLSGKLDEMWDAIDTNKDHVMDKVELKELLGRCSQVQPTDEVVEELFLQMAGSHSSAVTKTEFIEYLSSLRGHVAQDRVIEELRLESQTPMAKSANDEDFSSSDDEDSTEDSEDIETAGLGAHGPLARGLTIETLNRKIPGFCQQYMILSRRQIGAWWRNGRMRAIFLLAIDLGAIVLGMQDRFVTSTPPWQAMGMLNVHTALALLIAIFALGLFGSDRPVFWRESSNGLNIPAHFLARIGTNWVDLIIYTFSFTALYFVIAQPNLNYWQFAWPFLLVTFCASGWGYVISSLVPPAQGAFIVSLIIFVSCGLLGNPASLAQYMTGGSLEYFVDAFSITRWSVSLSFGIFYKMSKPLPAGNLQTQMFCLAESLYVSEVRPRLEATMVLLLQGLVLHVLAFLGIRFMNRDKQV